MHDRTPFGGRRLYIDRTGQRIAIGMFVIVLIIAIVAMARQIG